MGGGLWFMGGVCGSWDGVCGSQEGSVAHRVRSVAHGRDLWPCAPASCLCWAQQLLGEELPVPCELPALVFVP